MTQPLLGDTVQSVLNDLETQVHNLETHAILDISTQTGVQQVNTSLVQVFNARSLVGRLPGGSALTYSRLDTDPTTTLWTIGTFSIQNLPWDNRTLMVGMGEIILSGTYSVSPYQIAIWLRIYDSVGNEIITSGYFLEADSPYVTFRPYVVFNVRAEDDAGWTSVFEQGQDFHVGTFKAAYEATSDTGTIVVSPGPASSSTDSTFDLYNFGAN